MCPRRENTTDPPGWWQHPCQHPGTSATVQTGLLHDPRGCWDGVETRQWPLPWVPGEALQRPCHTLSTVRVLGSRTGGDCSPRAGLSSRPTPGRPEAEHTRTQPGSQAEYQAHILTPLRASDLGPASLCATMQNLQSASL